MHVLGGRGKGEGDHVMFLIKIRNMARHVFFVVSAMHEMWWWGGGGAGRCWKFYKMWFEQTFNVGKGEEGETK